MPKAIAFLANAQQALDVYAERIGFAEPASASDESPPAEPENSLNALRENDCSTKMSARGCSSTLAQVGKNLSFEWEEAKVRWRDAKAEEFERTYLNELPL